MWGAWSLLLLGLLMTSGPVIWVRSDAAQRTRLRRTGHVALAYTVLISMAGIFWLPPIAAVADVESASRSAAVTAGALSCEDSAQALPRLERVSNGLITLSGDGGIAIPSRIWLSLSREQRAVILGLVSQVRECSSGESRPLIVRDPATEELLFRGTLDQLP